MIKFPYKMIGHPYLYRYHNKILTKGQAWAAAFDHWFQLSDGDYQKKKYAKDCRVITRGINKARLKDGETTYPVNYNEGLPGQAVAIFHKLEIDRRQARVAIILIKYRPQENTKRSKSESWMERTDEPTSKKMTQAIRDKIMDENSWKLNS
eukprot:GHVN01103213.1.p1 GENE.GHVN01103213.1~~GHVN01103213.1.p1  ORF type:complete len:151 (-),score=11.43 GHVN01103213.1:569-1021(-)